MLVIQQMYDPAGPLAAWNDFRARAKQTQQAQSGRLLDHVHCIARYQQFGYIIWKGLGHVAATDVGNALQCQIHVNRITWVQVIFDALDDQFD